MLHKRVLARSSSWHGIDAGFWCVLVGFDLTPLLEYMIESYHIPVYVPRLINHAPCTIQRRVKRYYMAFPQCHVSMFTNTSFTNTSKNGIFGDQIREMDWAVGRVLAAVAAHNLMHNTIFFFTSDHGPHVELCLEGGTAGHLRGGKGDSSWEGG